MDFGEALKALKAGKKMQRAGQNGRGVFVVFQKGYPDGIPCNKQTAKAWGLNEGDPFACNPYLQIKNVDGSHSMWVPSINDCLAEDWQVIEQRGGDPFISPAEGEKVGPGILGGPKIYRRETK